MFGSLGFDYFLTNRTTVSLTGIKVHGKFTPLQELNILQIFYIPIQQYQLIGTRNTNSKREFNANGLQFGIKHLFPKEGETISLDLNYFAGHNENSSLYVTDYYDNGPGSSIGGLRQTKSGWKWNQ